MATQVAVSPPDLFARLIERARESAICLLGQVVLVGGTAAITWGVVEVWLRSIRYLSGLTAQSPGPPLYALLAVAGGIVCSIVLLVLALADLALAFAFALPGLSVGLPAYLVARQFAGPAVALHAAAAALFLVAAAFLFRGALSRTAWKSDLRDGPRFGPGWFVATFAAWACLARLAPPERVAAAVEAIMKFHR